MAEDLRIEVDFFKTEKIMTRMQVRHSLVGTPLDLSFLVVTSHLYHARANMPKFFFSLIFSLARISFSYNPPVASWLALMKYFFFHLLVILLPVSNLQYNEEYRRTGDDLHSSYLDRSKEGA